MQLTPRSPQPGSETTATLLTGALYHLLTYPSTLTLLLSEIRTAFPQTTRPTMATTAPLPYLNAVLEESLRVYPPSAFAQARIVPADGAVVCGEVLPAGTSVGVATLAASLSDKSWVDGGAFRPERWLGEGWEGDDRRAMQPFIVGPRNCLGRK